MESGRKWSQLLNNWPEGLPKKGLITTTLDELIPFKGFMLSEEMAVLERTTPDPSGTRCILLGFETIAQIKLIDPPNESILAAAGFVGKLSAR
jgi:hypothetical protein